MPACWEQRPTMFCFYYYKKGSENAMKCTEDAMEGSEDAMKGSENATKDSEI